MIALWASGLERQRRLGARLHVAALHAQDPAVAEDLLPRSAPEPNRPAVFVGSFTPVMVAHTGPSLAGLAWWWEAPPGAVGGRPRRAAAAAATG